MHHFLEQVSGVRMIPEPISQVGSYELDLLRLYYFSWINTLSLGLNVWQQQFVQDGDE